MGTFSEYSARKSNRAQVSGITEIIHSARVKGGLSMEEYAILDLLTKKGNKKYGWEIFYRKLGMSADDASAIIKKLRQKGYIGVSGGTAKVLPLFNQLFESTEAEFEEFWTIVEDKKLKAAWGGSKPEAKKHYTTLRRKYSAEYLLSQRNDYFRYLEYEKTHNKFNRAKMGGPVFLNPDKERFKEEWAEHLPKPEKPKGKLTEKDKEKLFNE